MVERGRRQFREDGSFGREKKIRERGDLTKLETKPRSLIYK